MKAPYTIRTIIEQMGGTGINGGFCYIGALKGITFKHPDRYTDCECRSSFTSEYDKENNTINFDVGIMFPVNGKRGQGWKMVISYEPDDTYSVFLWSAKVGLIDHRSNVYCDELQHTVESMYDRAMAARSPKKLARLDSMVGMFG